MPHSAKPVLTHVTYRPKKGKEQALYELVKRHWPILHAAGLATSEPATVYRATSKKGEVSFIEIFSWKDADASGKAHQLPQVMAVWEPMGKVLQGGFGPMGGSPEIAFLEPIAQ
jgi:hypothetical protein